MHHVKISVIVPVYNTADYLPKCIESIMKQTYQNIEIIMVDDGSTDDSGKICENYALQDSRIIVISQENRGNNAARKTGLAACTGEYITFVDSDDFIGKELVARLYEQTEKHNADMVISNVRMIRVDGSEEERKNLIQTGVYNNPYDSVKRLFFYSRTMDENGRSESCTYGIIPFLFGKLYRRELLVYVMWQINDEIQYDEDRALVWTCLMQDIKVVFIEDMEYYYCQRQGGLVRSKDELYLAKMNYFYCYMKRLFAAKEKVLTEQLEQYLLWNVKVAFRWKLGLVQSNLLDDRSKYVLDPSVFFNESKKVVLYGAGIVGRNYHSALQKSKNVRISAWVDKEWEKRIKEGLDVMAVEEILKITYDYILVAIKSQDTFQKIKAELQVLGVDQDKIIWGNPIGG